MTIRMGRYLYVVSPLDKNAPIALLSVGSGELLQEFFILIKLFHAGFRNIKLVMLDPIYSWRAKYERKVFLIIIDTMKKLYGLEIEPKFLSTITELNIDDKFDVVYAIDYDNLDVSRDYSLRQLDGRNSSVKHEDYQTAITFLKSLNLLKDSTTSFAAISKGKDIARYNKGNMLPAKSPVIFSISGLPVTQDTQFDHVYLYANIGHLIFNLNFLCESKSVLLINENLVHPDDKKEIDNLLQSYGIKHCYVSEAEALNFIREPNKHSLILDGTLFHSDKKELPVSKEFLFAHGRVFVARIDAEKLRKVSQHKNVPSSIFSIYRNNLGKAPVAPSGEDQNLKIEPEIKAKERMKINPTNAGSLSFFPERKEKPDKPIPKIDILKSNMNGALKEGKCPCVIEFVSIGNFQMRITCSDPEFLSTLLREKWDGIDLSVDGNMVTMYEPEKISKMIKMYGLDPEEVYAENPLYVCETECGPVSVTCVQQ